MSSGKYTALDEPTLRTMLEGTMNLDERRLIRSAIRELRQREIEEMQAALASKRFRATSLHLLEDKENRRRSDSSDSLDLLSGKLQAIQDIEELTGLLRGTSEYEERKLIRAAIRQLRDKELQSAVEKARALSRRDRTSERHSSLTSVDPDAESLGEREQIRSQIRELRSQQSQSRELHQTGSTGSSTTGMTLVLDTLGKEESSGSMGTHDCLGSGTTDSDRAVTQHQRETLGDSDPSLGSALSRPGLDSEASENSFGFSTRATLGFEAPGCSVSAVSRACLDLGVSEHSVNSATRARLDSGASESSAGSQSCLLYTLDCGTCDTDPLPQLQQPLDSGEPEGGSDLRTSALSQEMPSLQLAPVEEPAVTESSSSSSSDSESENHSHVSSGPAAGPSDDSSTTDTDREQPDGAVFSRKVPGAHNGLLNGSLKARNNGQDQKIWSKDTPLRKNKDPAVDKKDPVVSSFSRASSIRDRMRKFTEPAPSMAAPTRASLKNGVLLSTRGQSPVSKVTQRFEETALSKPQQDRGPEAGAPQQKEREHFVSCRTSSATSSSSLSESAGVPLQRRMGVKKGPSSRPLVAFPQHPTSSQSQSPGGGTLEEPERQRPALATPDENGSVLASEAVGDSVSQSKGEGDPDMKTFLTIEIKDGRNTPADSMAPRITSSAAANRAELTLGLRPTPFKISSSGVSSSMAFKVDGEPTVATEPAFVTAPSARAASEAPTVSNGSSEVKTEERTGKLTAEQLAAIEDEEVLDRMLDESKDFDERKMIRAAMRELRKRKRDQRERERESRLQDLRQQREERFQKGRPGGGAGEVVVKKVEKSADGSTLSQVTKTDRFAQSSDGSRSSRSTILETSYVQKFDKGTVQTKSYSYTSSSSSSTTKKVGSVFDREDDSAHSSQAALERRQAEKRKELMRAQTLPKTSAMQSRRAMIEKLEKESGGPANPAVARVNKVQRSTSFGVPNANSIKQMLLDWCRAKTRSYENVDIQNFSSSWSDGMAFCALVHNFFPEAFDYSALSPSNRRQNFEMAFKTAENLADCPQLLDVEDMVRLREPDWKCVYTYLQEFYRALAQKGLVKTKNS
ncbi:smoothelin isoform X1 [Scleropages formosus]|uniref:Smoothelin n=3 Tax=Scleropages formosus TaxID=113540 RepID=A0A8C9QTD4_SCLFO|nr:smoothelin-like isoform X1 [Scleropages formosus]